MRALALILAVLAALLPGCATGEPAHTTAWLGRLSPFKGAVHDLVQMDVALIEGPVGDRFLDQNLWTLTDEQVIGLEHKAVLEDNGFRIGQVGGIPPAELQQLLMSERTCVNPQRIQLHAGNSKQLSLGPALAACRFELHQEGKPRVVSLQKADCLLSVEPTLTPDGRTRLRFTPQIRYGEDVLVPQPTVDRTGWERQRPTEEYRWLSWEVTLAPNEYVLVGTSYARPGTLGHQCFLRMDGPRPVQHVLAIRTSRAPAALDAPADDALGAKAPPLAVQASWSCARGSKP